VPASSLKEKFVSVSRKTNDGPLTFKVNLEMVPKQVREVRLRGRFNARIYYEGKIPRGWKAPPNLRVSGSGHDLILPPQKFDVKIKTADEPMPTVNVSREPKIEVLRAVWVQSKFWNRFELHLRH
jgi:hypothetical protein